ncbi:hypothetical protein [Paenirhodobacter enshiensis]|uniref:Peptidase inhibitor I78 family protein n=2 Tax=Paenirhodobacter enshiensis TaxID=1105367 RepID=A0A086XU83_9RHOB|nr:hypothetical protein [Paenirhodobacter enshiensis]KFI25583.1 hypothetical protein CG50_05190 [Paenirhodobacter enshiensis]
MMIRFTAIALGAAMLAGCQSTTQDKAPSEPVPTPYMTPAVQQEGALEQRSPDTCGNKKYSALLGQPGAAIQAAHISQPVSVVEWRGIEPQIYNPERVVFRLDQNGNVFNIDCG